MFRITEDPSSGSLEQCLAKNYKNDSIVSVDMDKVHFKNCTRLPDDGFYVIRNMFEHF